MGVYNTWIDICICLLTQFKTKFYTWDKFYHQKVWKPTVFRIQGGDIHLIEYKTAISSLEIIFTLVDMNFLLGTLLGKKERKE